MFKKIQKKTNWWGGVMRQELIYLQKNGLKVLFKQIVPALMQVINREMIFFKKFTILCKAINLLGTKTMLPVWRTAKEGC